MEQQFEIVDRDYNERFEGVTSRDRGITEKIKLTEQSRNNMDNRYEKTIGQKDNEKSANTIETKNNENVENNMELINVDLPEYEVSHVIPTSKKAIKFAEYMVENTDNKYSEVVPRVSVENVDVDEIEDTVSESFDFYNINQPEETESTIDSIENYEPIESYDEQVSEESTLDNLVNSQEENVGNETYYAGEEEITPSIEDNKQSQYTEETVDPSDNIIPEIQDYFSSHDIDGSISDEIDDTIVEQEANDMPYEQSDVDLYNEVSNSIESESATIEDLDKLRQALQSERAMNVRLTQELEEKQMAAAQAEREEQEAVKEQEAKIIEFNDELNAIRNENAGLKRQTQIIEEQTQKTNSNVINIRDYVSALDRIMNDSGNYADKSSSISEGKGRVA